MVINSRTVCVIWTERNKRVHEDRFIKAQEIERRVIKNVTKNFKVTRYKAKGREDR